MKNSILLINPPLSLEERYGKEMAKFGAITEPLGLAYIAGMLEQQNIRVAILDAQAEKISIGQVIDHIRTAEEFTIVGISLLTPMHGVVKRLCDSIKQSFPHILIVLGGPHCTALKEQVLKEIESVDVVCIGEGEITMTAIAGIAERKELDSIEGICYRDNDSVKINQQRPFIKELDTIPPPARHLLPMDKYHLTASRVSGGSYCPTIIVARGCPFSCTYC
jgi:anaerobic magnesium-protoporphyrin IX monomethyl ester cyclase